MMIDDVFLKEFDALIEDLTPIEDMAILLNMPLCQLRLMIDDTETEVHQHFYRKLAEVQRDIRHRDIELAEANSPTAMEAVNSHLKRMLNSL